MTTSVQAPPTVREWSGWRTVLVVLGSLLIILGGGALVGGGAGLWFHQQRDAAGYYTAGPERFTTDTAALSVPSLDVNVGGTEAFSAEDMLGRARIRIESVNSGTPLFIGIAPADEVAKYLNGVGHDELSDIDVSPFKATYTPQPGGAPTAEPASQSFWVASDSGAGARTLDLKVADGNWTILIMNADGSPGVDATISAGAKLPAVLPISIIALATGSVLLLVGTALIVVPIATRRTGRVAVRSRDS